jgi:hypothetical protein
LFKIEGQLAAVDVTIDKKLGDQFNIKGFPTGNSFLNIYSSNSVD